MMDLSYKMFFKAFANNTRFKIIKLLRKGPRTVNDLSNKLGFEQSRVSHNLDCLVDCGFVVSEKKGKNKIYSLDKKTILPILNLVDKHIERYSEHLRACGVLEKKGG